MSERVKSLSLVTSADAFSIFEDEIFPYPQLRKRESFPGDTGEWAVSEEHVQAVGSLCDAVREVVMSNPHQDAFQAKFDELRELLVGEARPGGEAGLVSVVRNLQDIAKRQEVLNSKFDDQLSSLDKRMDQDHVARQRDMEKLQASLESLAAQVGSDIASRKEAQKEQRDFLVTVRNAVVGTLATLAVTGGGTLLYYGARAFFSM